MLAAYPKVPTQHCLRCKMRSAESLNYSPEQKGVDAANTVNLSNGPMPDATLHLHLKP